MPLNSVTVSFRESWPLTAQEVAHAMPVLQAAHTALRDLPPPRLATIRHLAARNGVADGTLRTALSRACSTGSLRLVDSRYSLGPTSIEQAAAANALRRRVPGYTLVVVLEGITTDLRPLREVLTAQGFRAMQRSLWVGARTVEDRLSAALRRAGFDHSIVVFHCDEVDAEARGRLAAAWNLADRADELRHFHARLFEHIAAPGIDSAEIAWRTVEAAPVWYRVAIQDEPPFPLELVEPDHPLDDLNAAWSAHLDSVSDHLVDIWMAVDR